MNFNHTPAAKEVSIQTDLSMMQMMESGCQTQPQTPDDIDSMNSFRLNQVNLHDMSALMDSQALLIERMTFGFKPELFSPQRSLTSSIQGMSEHGVDIQVS